MPEFMCVQCFQCNTFQVQSYRFQLIEGLVFTWTSVAGAAGQEVRQVRMPHVPGPAVCQKGKHEQDCWLSTVVLLSSVWRTRTVTDVCHQRQGQRHTLSSCGLEHKTFSACGKEYKT